MKICKKCGYINQDDAKFCSQCGQALPEVEETRDPIEHDHSYDADFGDPMKEEEHYRSPAEQMVDKSRQENAGYLESNNGYGARDVFGNVAPVLRLWGLRLTDLIAGIVFLLAGIACVAIVIVRFAQTGTLQLGGYGYIFPVAIIVIGIILLTRIPKHQKAINAILDKNPSALADLKKTPEFTRTVLTAVIMGLIYCGFAAIVPFVVDGYYSDLSPFAIVPAFVMFFGVALLLSIVLQKNRSKK